MNHWDDLPFWEHGEYDAVMDRLEDLERVHTNFNPSRSNLFAAMDKTPFEKITVAIFGQDPYPSAKHATGIAFDIPETIQVSKFPPTIQNIFKEYSDDLHYPYPQTGSLKTWVDQGVFLWNVIPTCEEGKSMSHAHWPEWQMLTEQVVKALSDKGIVFVFLGTVAQTFRKFVDEKKNDVLVFSHPSPRASAASKHPFFGSRMFSTINDKLADQGQTTINWRL